MSINSGEFAHFLCLECFFACWLLWELLLITGIPAQGLYFRWVLQFLFSRSLNLNWEDCIKWLNMHVYICIYYGLNACILETHIEIKKPDVMVSGVGPLMWSGHEGWTLINGISTLIKETHRASLPLPPWDDSLRRWLSATQEGPSQKVNHAGTVNLEYHHPQQWEINSVVYKPLSL